MSAFKLPLLALALAQLAAVAFGAKQVIYLKAVTYEWDFLPNRNPIDGSPRPEPYNHCADVPINSPDPPYPLPPNGWSTYTTDELGKKLMKAKYTLCTQAPASPLNPASWNGITCNPPVPATEFVNGEPVFEAHLGIMGPLIKAAPGDTITVYLLNALATVDTWTSVKPAPAGASLPTFPITIEPMGLQFDKADAVAPGAVGVFKWTVPASAAPSAEEPDWKLWHYKSTLDPTGTDNAGLFGPILVRRATALVDSPAMPDVITTLQVVDENVSVFYDYNVAKYNGGVIPTEEGLLKHTINGFLYCALPLPHLPADVGVRWHPGAIGTAVDMHTMHWHANTHLLNGRRADVLQMTPGSQYSVYMETRPTSVGTWLIHCHVDDHIHAGMVALYNVKGPKTSANFLKPSAAGGKIREYWVGAVMELWDYAGGNTAPDKNNCPASAGYAAATEWDWTKYYKVIYVEFERPRPGVAPFTIRKQRDAYLGIQGTVFKGQVGDTIKVHFKNMLPCQDPNDSVDPTFCHPPVSIHPHGVGYLKDSEGAPYADPVLLPNSNDLRVGFKADDWVYPGQEVEYNWGVTAGAGPGPKDASTVTWFYHPHTDEIGQPYAGMNGMIVIGRPGAFAGEDADGHLTGIKGMQDFNLVYTAFNEQSSYLWDYNQKYITSQGVDPLTLGNIKFSINGLIFCNNPPLQLVAGSTVRFHLLSAGTEVDLHTPTLPGGVFTALSSSTVTSGTTVPMLAGTMTVADVKVNAPVTTSKPAVLTCGTQSHAQWGERFAVTIGPGTVEAFAGNIRKYFIAADPVNWSFGAANSGTGNFLDKCPPAVAPFADATSAVPNYGAQPTYQKARYRLYTSEEFKTVAPGEPVSHGILGPLVSSEAGDIVQIVFKNKLSFDVNLRMEGALTVAIGRTQSYDAASPVAPGQTVTYNYFIPKSSGPSTTSQLTVAYAYSSSIDATGHANAGLIGIHSVGAKGAYPTLKSGTVANTEWEPKPLGITNVLPVLAHVFDENLSVFAAANGLTPGGAAPENQIYSLNGFVFCNGPDTIIKQGTKTRAMFLSYGSDLDIHSPRVAGQLLTTNSRTSAGADLLLPLVSITADFTPLDVGRFIIEDNMHAHRDMGERIVLNVQAPARTPPPPPAGGVRGRRMLK